MPLPLPAIPSLIGFSAYFQGAALGMTTGNGFVLSEALRIDLGR